MIFKTENYIHKCGCACQLEIHVKEKEKSRKKFCMGLKKFIEDSSMNFFFFNSKLFPMPKRYRRRREKKRD